jgi:hypothetical protein
MAIKYKNVKMNIIQKPSKIQIKIEIKLYNY